MRQLVAVSRLELRLPTMAQSCQPLNHDFMLMPLASLYWSKHLKSASHLTRRQGSENTFVCLFGRVVRMRLACRSFKEAFVEFPGALMTTEEVVAELLLRRTSVILSGSGFI
jgi:hypothetical protein